MKTTYKGSGYIAVRKADGQNLHYSQENGEITLEAGDKMFPAGQPYQTREGADMVTLGCEKPYIKPGVYRYGMQKVRTEGKSTVTVERIRDL